MRFEFKNEIINKFMSEHSVIGIIFLITHV